MAVFSFCEPSSSSGPTEGHLEADFWMCSPVVGQLAVLMHSVLPCIQSYSNSYDGTSKKQKYFPCHLSCEHIQLRTPVNLLGRD